jgi:hypothetical protein
MKCDRCQGDYLNPRAKQDSLLTYVPSGYNGLR